MGGDPTSVAMDGHPRRSGFPRQARCRQPDVAALGAPTLRLKRTHYIKLWSRHIRSPATRPDVCAPSLATLKSALRWPGTEHTRRVRVAALVSCAHRLKGGRGLGG